MLENNIELKNKVSIEQIGNEGILVHFLMDSEGTLFLKYDPTEMLDSFEQDLYFLAHPTGSKEYIRAKYEEIVKKNNLSEIFMSINVPNIYAVGDILAGKWLESRGCTKQQITEIRANIETKMRKWNDPYIIEHLMKKYPGLVITVVTQASPEEYVKKSYEETLKDTNAGLIIAPGYKDTTYTKMDPELYKMIKESTPAVVHSFVDDDPKREKPAKEGGVEVVKIYQSEKETLKETSEKALDDAYELL